MELKCAVRKGILGFWERAHSSLWRNQGTMILDVQNGNVLDKLPINLQKITKEELNDN